MLITTQDRRSVVSYGEPDVTALTVKTSSAADNKFDLVMVTSRAAVFLLGTFAKMGVAIDVMNDIADNYLRDADDYVVPEDPGGILC